jgi:hypothetical protein
MIFKEYYLNSHSDRRNLGDNSDEWGERFHQEIKPLETATNEDGTHTWWQITA